MFTKGQVVKCINDKDSPSITEGYNYTLLDVSYLGDRIKIRGDWDNVSWFSSNRFEAVKSGTTTPTQTQPKVDTFKDIVKGEIAGWLQDIATDNDYLTEEELKDDDTADVLITFANNVGLNVAIENSGLKISVD